MKVDIWSDVACPWCAMGTRRIAAALDRFPHRDDVEVRYRSFELDPGAPRSYPGDRTARIAAKIGTTPEQFRTMEARLAGMAAEDGLEIRFDRARDGNTADAHRLLHLAWELGGEELQTRVKWALVGALFTEGEPIGEPEALRRIAVAAGLPEADVDRVLGSDEYLAAVREDEDEARRLGITGVPFYVVDGRYGVSGAQSPDALLGVLERAYAESQAGTPSGNAR